MQEVELSDSSGFTLHCPFCGKLILFDEGYDTCNHVLFISTDEGFEYVDQKLGFDKDIDLEEIEEDLTMDEYTNRIKYENSVKFSIITPAPSFMCGYIGFSDK